MQAVLALVSRALTKFGIATAANRAIMATTTMISTRVKPVFRQLFLLILFVFHVGGVNDGERLVIIIRLQSFTDCLSPAAGQFLSKLSAGFFFSKNVRKRGDGVVTSSGKCLEIGQGGSNEGF